MTYVWTDPPTFEDEPKADPDNVDRVDAWLMNRMRDDLAFLKRPPGFSARHDGTQSVQALGATNFIEFNRTEEDPYRMRGVANIPELGLLPAPADCFAGITVSGRYKLGASMVLEKTILFAYLFVVAFVPPSSSEILGISTFLQTTVDTGQGGVALTTFATLEAGSIVAAVMQLASSEEKPDILAGARFFATWRGNV